jgi:DNA-binding XRE family transcriptional regulator
MGRTFLPTKCNIGGLWAEACNQINCKRFNLCTGYPQRQKSSFKLRKSPSGEKTHTEERQYWVRSNKLEHGKHAPVRSQYILKWDYSKAELFLHAQNLDPDPRVTKSLHSLKYRQLTALLVETRRKAGLTQQQVADTLKTHQSYIAKVENGERRIDVVEFMELATALGAVPSKLVKNLEGVFD